MIFAFNIRITDFQNLLTELVGDSFRNPRKFESLFA